MIPAAETSVVVKTRRGDLVYDTNPFIKMALKNTHKGVKRIANEQGDRMMVVSETTGEVIGGAGFWQTQEVDRTQFLKLYVNGVKAFAGLSAAGAKMFGVLYLEMQQRVGQDQVFLSYGMIDKAIFTDLSESTYTRGIKDLKEKNFLAASTVQGWFFVNPDFMWNGDRLAFVKEYRIKPDQRVKPSPQPFLSGVE